MRGDIIDSNFLQSLHRERSVFHGMPRFTVAICARNAESIIGRCLESIHAQSRKPDEILVAVDEPDDPTIEVARHYGARVIVTNSAGLYEARNAVLKACATEYLGFTDADCRLVPEWVEKSAALLDADPALAAVTGRHPPDGPRNFAAWLHHMWYVVEATDTGPTGGLIGGNSVFRVEALRRAGGWLELPGHSAAEDMYIAHALQRGGGTLWFEEGVAARHDYERCLRGLWRKAVMMGRDIVVMMRASGRRGTLWWYTLAIPGVLLAGVIGLLLLAVHPVSGTTLLAVIGGGSLAYFSWKLGGPLRAFPRWLARWILIVPYSWGILQGLTMPLPKTNPRDLPESAAP